MFLLILLLIVSPAFAQLGESYQATMPAKLYQLVQPYGGRVGLAFIDPAAQWEFTINGSSEFPAASVAKVPVMAAAYYLADQGKINLNYKVMFKESDKLGGSGVLQWLRGTRSYTLRNLIRLMIVLSDNTATRLVVNTLGLKEINLYIKSLGLTKTVVRDPTMLIEPPAVNNNITSPLDMAKLMQNIYLKTGFSLSANKEMISFMRNQRYHWGLWRGVSPGTVIANKTGNLEGILNDVGIVYTKKGNYILSVFTQGFKKQREARLIINNISKIAYEEYTGEKLAAPKTRVIVKAKPKYKYKSKKIGAKKYKAKKLTVKKSKSKRLLKKRTTKRQLSRRPSQTSKQR